MVRMVHMVHMTVAWFWLGQGSRTVPTADAQSSKLFRVPSGLEPVVGSIGATERPFNNKTPYVTPFKKTKNPTADLTLILIPIPILTLISTLIPTLILNPNSAVAGRERRAQCARHHNGNRAVCVRAVDA